MKDHIVGYVENTIALFTLLVVGFTPLLFSNQTTEFYEMPKLVLLVIATLILLGLWIFSWIVRGKVSITRTPLDIPLLLLLAGILLSTFFSASRSEAIYGNFPQVSDSAVAWVCYILLYFLAVSNLRHLSQIKTLLYVLYASAVVVAVVSLLSFFHIFLPFDFAQAVNFTPTGSVFSTVALLLLLLPLPLLSIVNPNKYLPLPASIVLAILFGVTIALIGSLPAYIILLAIFVICFVVSNRQQAKKMLPYLLIPVVVVGLVFVLAYVPLPGFNAISQMEAHFPKEIQLPFSISWKVSASAFRDAPFIGTGPSSYLSNFTIYKPIEFNTFNFWNFSFGSAYNEFLQMLGTLGIIGFVALVWICIVILVNSWRNLSSITESVDEHTHLVPAFAVSGLVVIMLFAVHATTLVSVVSTMFVLAVLMASQKSIRERVMNFSMGIKASTAEKQFDLFPIIVFVVFLILAVTILLKSFNAVAADYYHRKALSLANTNGSLTYQYLQKAETLNPNIDLYRVDLAQTNFALANAIAVQKGPSKSNPKGSLTDQDKKTIQTLLSQAINEGRVSVALNPRSARNWEVLASIYRNITGVAQNALAFSLDAYGRAIQLDPVNPALRLTVGGIYYSAKNYPLAVRFFTDAANLKPDYANSYYNLSIALRDSGDLQNALSVAQQTVVLLQQNKLTNTPDYKTAQALVSDLKEKIAKAAKDQNNQVTAKNNQTAPAAKTNSALQNKNITDVNVGSLDNPPTVKAAPTVKPNPNAKVPVESVTPTLSPTATPTR
jgi:O-antigen ligase